MLWCGQMQLHRIQFLKIDENLTSVQRWELDVVLDDFSEVLDDIPGQTDITAHHINTDNSSPIHKAPHKIPHAHKGHLKMN